MKSEKDTVAYIDGANLHEGIKSLGWEMNYSRFRVWLSDKYGVGVAYIFIGMIPKQKDLYSYLQKSGFTLVYKEVIYSSGGKAKGNCDADLIVQAMSDLYEGKAKRAVLVTSDGDYVPLVKFWQKKKQPLIILSPAPVDKCSLLLKRTSAPISYLNDQKNNFSAIK